MRSRICLLSLWVWLTCFASTIVWSQDTTILGRWSFTLPDGNPAWMQVVESNGQRHANLLWSVGSARPATIVDMNESQTRMRLQRKINWKPYGKSIESRRIKEPMTATIASQDALVLTFEQSFADPNHPRFGDDETVSIVGRRLPPIPPRPDLSQVRFGEAIQLFNGKDLTGWRLSNEEKKNGWRVENGELVNETPKMDFAAYGKFGNLRTNEVFGDFQLEIEYNVPSGGNSGIYLRGMYEAQVVDRDSKMQGIQGPGAIFGRIKPNENAGHPGGEWNLYVLTLVDQHISVKLNGKLVIDNQPLLGCTGGGIQSDDTKPGCILLQGDHTSVRYRNLRLHPIKKE